MAGMMKAMVARKYGAPHKVLRLEEVPIPVPAGDEVLVKIEATSVNAIDWHLIRAKPVFVRATTGFISPKDKIPGHEVSGTVTGVGPEVRKLKTGDEIMGRTSLAEGRGAFAEYVCVTEKDLVLKPRSLPFQEAACIPVAGLTALQAVREEGKVAEGDKVLITGASGGVGSFLVQLCKAFNAEVTATCSSAKVEAVRAMGADRVIDYSQTDYTQEEIKYDVILDGGGFTHIKKVVRVLKPDGTYVHVGGSITNFFKTMAFGSCYKSKGMTLKQVDFHQTSQDLEDLLELVVQGKVKVVLDRSFGLKEVGDAIRFMESRKVIGKIPIHVP